MGQIYFTIVIPAYNRAMLITSALISVVNQTLEDFECIVIDDGSDDSRDLIDVIDKLNDGRFHYVRQTNSGGGSARNAGISLARGRYIAFLDSDDHFVRDKLQIVHDFIEENCLEKKDVVYSMATVDRGVGKCWVRPSRCIRPDEHVAEYLFVANEFIQTSTIVIRSDFAREVGFDPTLRKGQDLDLCVRLFAEGARFKMIARPIVIWNDRTEINRVSRTTGYEAPKKWLEQSESLLTPRAVAGYKANVLAYYASSSSKMLALRYLVNGLLFGGVPPRVIMRQALRCIMPPAVYRAAVNSVVRAVGR